MNPPLGLELRNLQCHRGDRKLFSELHAHVRPGQLLRVMGANGAGKTSLLRMVCGLLAPTQGAILWHGTPIWSDREAFARQLAYIGHASATKDDLTALENLRISTALRGLHISTDQAKTALHDAGLGQHWNMPVRLLSQGQRRRVALAQLALPSPAHLWVLDEPFTALDTPATQWLASLLLAHARNNGTTVLTSHHDVPLDAAISKIEVAL